MHYFLQDVQMQRVRVRFLNGQLECIHRDNVRVRCGYLLLQRQEYMLDF